MKTLICASNPTFSATNINPLKPKVHGFHPRTVEKLSYSLSTLKPHANAKGFSVGVPMWVGFGIFTYIWCAEGTADMGCTKMAPVPDNLNKYGASTLGIAYGALSTSLEAVKEGSFLGLGWKKFRRRYLFLF
ncbi:hypothetical protein L6164_005976 [Bauhinia variegata]|uniref:Uncharacterized protein n=1 Tax=Bauhinia variegata TaxID=167791 RepID=A0ACB9PSY3_BAUVA|nr:hypothetical protein L6164_005976 [Bauhinia variegata]